MNCPNMGKLIINKNAIKIDFIILVFIITYDELALFLQYAVTN